jgi:hypothetical protein
VLDFKIEGISQKSREVLVVGGNHCT